MRSVRLLASALSLLALGGCATERIQVIDVRAISEVQAQIKNQVGVYMLASRQTPRPVIHDVARSEESPFWCGRGAIGFDISTIKVKLTTTLDTTTGASGGIKTPVLTLTGGFSRESINTQVLTYNLWPVDMADQPPEFQKRELGANELQKAEIAKVLLSLRDALILSALKYDYPLNPKNRRAPQPCFLDYNPDNPGADAGNTFVIALNITYNTTGDISVALATPIAPTFSLTDESRSTTGNSITVSFVQQGVTVLQKKKDAMDRACAKPVKDKAACVLAEHEYEAVKKANEGLGQAVTIE